MNDTNGSTDTVYIPSDRLQMPVLEFVQSSALRFCTDVQTRADDSIAVTPSWPPAGFSSGEKIAWQLLQDMVNGTLRQAFNYLDPTNLAALSRAVDKLTVEVSL